MRSRTVVLLGAVVAELAFAAPALAAPKLVVSLSQRKEVVEQTAAGRTTRWVETQDAKPGDVVAFRPRSAKSEDVQAVVASNRSKTVPGWLEVDWDNLKGRVLALPTRADVTLPVEEHLVVELYSK